MNIIVKHNVVIIRRTCDLVVCITENEYIELHNCHINLLPNIIILRVGRGKALSLTKVRNSLSKI